MISFAGGLVGLLVAGPYASSATHVPSWWEVMKDGLLLVILSFFLFFCFGLRLTTLTKAEFQEQAETQWAREVGEVGAFLRVLEAVQNQNLQHAVQDLREVGMYIENGAIDTWAKIVVPDIANHIRSSTAAMRLLFANALVAICKHYIKAHDNGEPQRFACTQAVYHLLVNNAYGRTYKEDDVDMLVYIFRQMEGYLVWPKGHILAK
ncbi:MAG: hypothetical protein PHD72_02120 [Patescibacteria group bacterium]|nr:hypothetical protein [Patescibacteria group bacterium]